MKINEQFPLKDTGSSNTESHLSAPRHRWYYFKEGFSPELVEYAIQQSHLKSDDYILDPFNGSGTVTLTCNKKSINAFGIEVNPFADFLARTKLADIKSEAVFNNVKEIRKSVINCRSKSPLLNFSTFSQQDHLTKWLFKSEILNAFQSGFNSTHGINNTSTRRIMQLALLRSAMENCNAIRDGKCFRYKKNWEKLKLDKLTFLESFDRIISEITLDLKSDPIKGQHVSFLKGDCRKILKNGLKQKFKLCITSPPYLNSFDYTDVYRPELFLGGFIKSQEELLSLRKRTLRSHALAKRSELLNGTLGLMYETVMKRIEFKDDSPWQRKIPVMIQAFFEDMKMVLIDLLQSARQDGQLWLVVSNSAYNDIEIPVDLILADIASNVGWKLLEIGVLRNIHKRGSKYSPDIFSLRESVIILKKLNI